MTFSRIFAFVAFIISCFFIDFANALEPMLVKKQQFELASFTTQNGAVIAPVRIGFESYGKLNAKRDNVILITHYFSGTSHAAGKYQATDAQAGYWDAIIGPGKAIDTNKFFVISSDTLVNLNAFDPNVITTGPASINVKTGKPWGLAFPVVTITDFVEVQKALLDSLGINKLYAVIGPSMGSFQAIEWAVRYPDQVERLVPVIGSAEVDAFTAVKLERWAYPIKQDPAWQQGDYYQSAEKPTEGLATAMAYVTQDALHPRSFNQKYPSLTKDKAAAIEITASFSAWDQLMATARQRSSLQDANHLLYLVRASQLWRAGMGDNWQHALAKVKAKTLFLPASGDLLLTADSAIASQKALQATGNNAQLVEIQGDFGHLDGLFNISTVGPVIQQFLAK
ncbi:MAG: homoserine O-acetyltransferase [Gammaproteobacteria bacterium]|nr:homoserine O-acetyltransferase [Gammaproteobacteria bacterium]